jgi:endonuclease/exonuclease/phosphatase (EEP) superfamily protein YafD
MRLLRHLEDRAALALRLWIMAGIVLRVTRLRDRFDGLSLVFYSTPWPVMAAAFVGLAVHFRRRGNWHAVRRYSAFTVAALFTWFATSWYSAPVPDTAPDLRFVHWNVARPDWRLDGCAKWLLAQDADVICLAETEPLEKPTLDRWRAAFPQYTLIESPVSLVCLVRGEVLGSEAGSLGPASTYALHRLRIRGRAVNVLQVDLIAKPTRSRRAAIEKLTEIAARQTDGNLIVAGDFNTPRESWHLQTLRETFVNAFEASGRGLAETWPSFAPALSLDQVWLGRAWQPLSCANGGTWRSDHRPVLVTAARSAR